MSTSRHIDKICLAAIAVTLIITILFMNGAALGLSSGSRSFGYEKRLFSTDQVHTIDIVTDEWDSFLETCENEEYIAVNLTIDGEKFNNVGLRAKGNTSLSSVSSMGSQRYSFKLEFDQYQDGNSYYGLDKLCLNNLIQDNTMMKDYVVYQMMADFGVTTSLCSYVYITVNGEDWGLYLAVEGVEDSFLQRNYGSDSGELYKPDSMSMGGGRGNGQDFDMNEVMEDAGITTEQQPSEEAAAADSASEEPADDTEAAEDSENAENAEDSEKASTADADEKADSSAAAATAQTDANAPGSFSFADMGNGFDPSSMPDMGSFDSSSMPDMGSFDSSSMPDMGSFDSSSMPDMGSFDPSSLPDTGSSDTASESDSGSSDAAGESDTDSNDAASAPDMSSFASSGMPDMSSFDPSSMPDMGSFDLSNIGNMFGNMFGGMGSSDVSLKYSDDDPDSYSNIFNNAKTDITKADQERLIDSLEKLTNYEDLESVLNMEEVLRYFVVHNFVVNGDSYTGTIVHNYYLHESDGQLEMIPWDYNLAFGTFMGGDASSSVNADIDNPVSTGSSDDRPMVGWIFSDEAYTEQYHALFSEFLAEWIDGGKLSTLIEDTAEMLRPYVESDPTKFCTTEEFEAGVETLSEFISLRGEAVSLQLAGDDTAVETNGLSTSAMGSMGGSMGGGGGGGGGFSFGGFPGGSFDGMPSPPDGAMPDPAQETASASETASAEETAEVAEMPRQPTTQGTADAADTAAEETEEAEETPQQPTAQDTADSADSSAEEASSSPQSPSADGGTAFAQGPQLENSDGQAGGMTPPGDMSFPGSGETTAAASTANWIWLGVSAIVLLLGLLIAIKKKY